MSLYGEVYEIEFDVRVKGAGAADAVRRVVVPVYANNSETAIGILAEALRRLAEGDEQVPNSQDGF